VNDDTDLEVFRGAVRQALIPLVEVFRENIQNRGFADAIGELERILATSERVLDEELGVLDQLLYEELSRALNHSGAQA
jgi:hypothetical protein